MPDLLTERVVRYRLGYLVMLYCNTAWALANGAESEAFIGRSLDTVLTSTEREGMIERAGSALRILCSRATSPASARPGGPTGQTAVCRVRTFPTSSQSDET